MNAAEIMTVFDQCFSQQYRTHLVGGAAEPYYRAGEPATIFFRQDYAASALHEVSHWCLAGSRRRRLDDYGYWYIAERDVAKQREFEAVEARPQALERLFACAADVEFRVSVDNMLVHDRQHLRCAVQHATLDLLHDGLPARAAMFADALWRCRTGERQTFENNQFTGLPI